MQGRSNLYKNTPQVWARPADSTDAARVMEPDGPVKQHRLHQGIHNRAMNTSATDSASGSEPVENQSPSASPGLTRRDLLRAGWVVPVVIAAGLPKYGLAASPGSGPNQQPGEDR